MHMLGVGPAVGKAGGANMGFGWLLGPWGFDRFAFFIFFVHRNAIWMIFSVMVGASCCNAKQVKQRDLKHGIGCCMDGQIT